MKPIQIEQLAAEILDYLVENKMWVDVSIYFNGKVWSSYNPQTGEFHYNDKSNIYEATADPKDRFEFAGDILSMSFDGALYEVMNGATVKAHELQQKFNDILDQHGVYYELGNAWNLTLYEE